MKKLEISYKNNDGLLENTARYGNIANKKCLFYITLKNLLTLYLFLLPSVYVF